MIDFPHQSIPGQPLHLSIIDSVPIRSPREKSL
jgi:hypothetical protein